jgi:hypothetical protein
MRRVALLAALALAASAAPVAASPAGRATAAVPAAGTTAAVGPHRAVFVGAGFDNCVAPSTATMRAWLGSRYRAIGIYIGGSQLSPDCRGQNELTKRWVSTVVTNGWSLIPVFVDKQPPCQLYAHKKTFSPANARSAGRDAADRAVSRLQSLGIGHGNPVYVDFEHFDESNATCVGAAVDFVEAWTNRLHTLHFTAGVYAIDGAGIDPIARKAHPRPDDIWWARWDGHTTTNTSALHGHWKGHRIHQWRGDHNEAYNNDSRSDTTQQIDNDSVHADVVGKVRVAADSAPYDYRASPPYGFTLKARTGPSTDDSIDHGYSAGDSFSIACQAVGETINGDYVWDRLTDGTYVSDINTTTTGGLSFTRGIPRCDTTAPTTPPLAAVPPATLRSARTFSWSASSDAGSGIASYELRWRRAKWSGGFGAWHHVRHLTAKHADVALAPGNAYCVQVRALDRSGNSGAWSARQCTARPLDDRALTRSTTGWSRGTGPHFYLHTATTTSSRQRSLSTAGKASVDRVGLVATRCPSCGSVDVYVGTHLVGSISLHASARHRRSLRLLPAFPLRSGVVHVVTTSKGKQVQIDGLLLSRT